MRDYRDFERILDDLIGTVLKTAKGHVLHERVYLTREERETIKAAFRELILYKMDR